MIWCLLAPCCRHLLARTNCFCSAFCDLFFTFIGFSFVVDLFFLFWRPVFVFAWSLVTVFSFIGVHVVCNEILRFIFSGWFVAGCVFGGQMCEEGSGVFVVRLESGVSVCVTVYCSFSIGRVLPVSSPL